MLSGLLFAQLDLSDWAGFSTLLGNAVAAAIKDIGQGAPSPMAPYKAMFLPLQVM